MSSCRGGFTLIEVLGALVVFSVGVLMVMSMTSGISERLRITTVRMNLAIEGQQRLDSLGALEFDSVSVGSVADTVLIENERYTCTITVSQSDPLARRVQLVLSPVDGTGPDFRGTVYLKRRW